MGPNRSFVDKHFRATQFPVRKHSWKWCNWAINQATKWTTKSASSALCSSAWRFSALSANPINKFSSAQIYAFGSQREGECIKWLHWIAFEKHFSECTNSRRFPLNCSNVLSMASKIYRKVGGVGERIQLVVLRAEPQPDYHFGARKRTRYAQRCLNYFIVQ